MRRGTPGPVAVARRAAILATVVVRGVTELEDDAVGFAYFDELDLARDAEPEELEVIRAVHEPFTRAAPDQVHATSSRIVERRIAVSWLQGYHELYSEGDTST